MTRLTGTRASEVTRDWNSIFQGLTIYRPRHLLRRVGPLLVGIILERDSSYSSYRPTFHVHNLARQFPVVSMMLATPLRTKRSQAPERIQVSSHDAKYEEAAQRLESQALLPLVGDLTLREVLDAYRAFTKQQIGMFQPELFEDMALIAIWASQRNTANQIIDEAVATMTNWPKEVLAQMGGIEEWIAEIGKKLDSPEKIRETVDKEIKKHKLDNIPVSNLKSGDTIPI